MRRSLPFLHLVWALPLLMAPLANASESFCTIGPDLKTESRLQARAALASNLARNTSELIRELEALKKSSKRVAVGSSVLFGVSGSTLAIAASAEIGSLAATRAATSTLAKGVQKGAHWFYLWRTGGETTLGYAWEYASNSGAAILLNDKWAGRKLKPVLKKINEVARHDFRAVSESDLSTYLEVERQRILELEKQADPQLYDGRLMSLGWDDVHHIQVLLAASKARFRLYEFEQQQSERLLWEQRAKCLNAPYGEALRLAVEAQRTLANMQNGAAIGPRITDTRRKSYPEWRSNTQEATKPLPVTSAR